jgi:hypothetical protein
MFLIRPLRHCFGSDVATKAAEEEEEEEQESEGHAQSTREFAILQKEI